MAPSAAAAPKCATCAESAPEIFTVKCLVIPEDKGARLRSNSAFRVKVTCHTTVKTLKSIIGSTLQVSFSHQAMHLYHRNVHEADICFLGKESSHDGGILQNKTLMEPGDLVKDVVGAAHCTGFINIFAVFPPNNPAKCAKPAEPRRPPSTTSLEVSALPKLGYGRRRLELLHNKHVVLVAPHGAGKTSFVLEASKVFESLGLACVYVTFAGCHGLTDCGALDRHVKAECGYTWDDLTLSPLNRCILLDAVHELSAGVPCFWSRVAGILDDEHANTKLFLSLNHGIPELPETSVPVRLEQAALCLDYRQAASLALRTTLSDSLVFRTDLMDRIHKLTGGVPLFVTRVLLLVRKNMLLLSPDPVGFRALEEYLFSERLLDDLGASESLAALGGLAADACTEEYVVEIVDAWCVDCRQAFSLPACDQAGKQTTALQNLGLLAQVLGDGYEYRFTAPLALRLLARAVPFETKPCFRHQFGDYLIKALGSRRFGAYPGSVSSYGAAFYADILFAIKTYNEAAGFTLLVQDEFSRGLVTILHGDYMCWCLEVEPMYLETDNRAYLARKFAHVPLTDFITVSLSDADQPRHCPVLDDLWLLLFTAGVLTTVSCTSPRWDSHAFEVHARPEADTASELACSEIASSEYTEVDGDDLSA